MKIIIVGLGGIGGMVGGKLSLAAEKTGKNNIVLFCRGKTLEAVKKNGLEIRAGGQKYITHAYATDNANEIGTADVVIFAVKNYSLEQAAQDIAPAVGDNTIILPLLNGVEAYEILKKTFPKSNVAGGCIYIFASIVEPGVVEQTGNMIKIVLGGQNCTELKNTLNAAGIESLLSPDIDNEMWMKFIPISGLATVTSMFGRTTGEIFAKEDSANYFKGLLAEITKVAKAKGVKLADEVETASFNLMKGFPPEAKTSMQRDFEKGGKNELEALTGYICREAARLGVATPLYIKAYEKLKDKR